MIRNILDYLEKSADCNGNKSAFVGEHSRLTFADLRDRARRIGSCLAGRIKKGEPVAVFMDKTPEAIAAFLGVVYAGGCYVPVDVSSPLRRVEMIFETLQNRYVIADAANAGKSPAEKYNCTEIIYTDAIETEISEDILTAIYRQMIDCDPLYIIFTSGSTGIPKGVVQSHRAVIDFTEWFSETACFDSDTVFGNQAPFYFDMSVKDIYGTLRNGATDFIVPKQLFSFPSMFFAYINENKINTLTWAVSAMSICADEEALAESTPQCLRCICFGGEALPVKALNLWRKYLPDAMYMNMYGPTEVAVDCTYYIVDREFENTEHLPAGRPCYNTDILILNGDEPAKTNEIGEICVRGTSLAYGYYNNPEKTKEVFIQNPLQTAYPELIYKTGDLGYFTESGEIMFSARKDHQIKHMGYRIELGEIESAIGAINGIHMNCCLYHKEKDKIICVYTGNLTKKEIVVELTRLLPKYMWPTMFVQLEEMPLNPNGKIDRVRLTKEYIG